MKNATLRQLRSSFERALSVAALPVAAFGCSDPGPGLEVEQGFLPMTCEDEEQIWLPSLTPQSPVDGMELLLPTFESDPPQVPEMIERLGTLCSGASDAKACDLELAALDTTEGFVFGACQDHFCGARLHATYQDEVFSAGNVDQVVAFLTPIDTAGEARFLVQASGFDVRCDRGGALPDENDFVVQAFKSVGCDGRDRFTFLVDSQGKVDQLSHVTEVEPDSNCVVGRRPEGLSWSCTPRRGIGGYLARAAALEAASVIAFEKLAGELEHHGAPRSLVRAARAAARDEVRHARVVARHAHRFGGTPQPTQIPTTPPRSLEAIALENATEGCVRETFGALVGHWQSAHASDPRLARSYRRITADEVRHAALSWRVARWLLPRLSAAEVRNVALAQQRAVAALGQELRHEPHPEIRTLAGVPRARTARTLFNALRDELWPGATHPAAAAGQRCS